MSAKTSTPRIAPDGAVVVRRGPYAGKTAHVTGPYSRPGHPPAYRAVVNGAATLVYEFEL